jgi:hypothetical protein
MVRGGVNTNTGGDADLQFLCLFNSFPVDVSRVEGSGDDDLGVDDFFVEGRVLAFLVIGDDEFMALGFEPFSDSELILDCAEQSGLFLCPFTTFVEDC